MSQTTWTATCFNPAVRDRLAQAAKVENTIIYPRARTKAIEKAVKYAQQQHPTLFKKEIES